MYILYGESGSTHTCDHRLRKEVLVGVFRGSSWLSTRPHVELTQTPAARHACKGFFLVGSFKVRSPTLNLDTTFGGRPPTRTGKKEALLFTSSPSVSLDSSSESDPFPQWFENFSLQDSNVDEKSEALWDLSGSPASQCDHGDIQSCMLNNPQIFGLSVRKSVLLDCSDQSM